MKKKYHLKLAISFFLLFTALTYAQDEIDDTVNELKDKISQVEGAEKLKLLDSLCVIIRHKPEYKYDSIAKLTITQAIGLNAIDLAVKHASERIFFLANRAGKPKEAVKVFNEFLNNDFNTVDPQLSARLYLNGADGYFFSGQTFESISYYQKANKYAKQANDSVLMGKSNIYMSDAYADSGKFAEAGSILSKAEEVFEKTRDTLNLLTTYNSRANLYSRLDFFKEAKEVRDEIIEIALKRKDYRMLQSTYYNAAIDNGAENHLDLRIYNLTEALKYAKLGGLESYEMRILIALLQANSVNNNLSEATRILNIIDAHPLRPKDGGLDDFHYIKAFANYNLALGDNNKAINLGTILLKLDSRNDFSNRMEAHGVLAKAYENVGDFKNSYKHFQLYSNIRDSINRIQNVKSLTYYQTLYETKKRDATIESQESEIALLDAENKIKSQWILFGGIGLLAIFSLIYLIRTKRFVETKQKMQEVFSQNLIEEQEKERSRLARELHDSVGQKLMLLSKTTKNSGNENAEQLASSTLEEVRSISRGLHPSNLERLGLTEAINALVYDINANTELFFTEDIDNIDNVLSKESELHLYRIIQESLNNIIKHAEAKAVELHVNKTKETIEIAIKDNGKGFDFESKYQYVSLGLKTLFERAKMIDSQLTFNSELNKGTTLNINIPI